MMILKASIEVNTTDEPNIIPHRRYVVVFNKQVDAEGKVTWDDACGPYNSWDEALDSWREAVFATAVEDKDEFVLTGCLPSLNE